MSVKTLTSNYRNSVTKVGNSGTGLPVSDYINAKQSAQAQPYADIHTSTLHFSKAPDFHRISSFFFLTLVVHIFKRLQFLQRSQTHHYWAQISLEM